MTIQVVAVLAFMLAAAWLVNNTIQNLDALGKDFSFGFLGAPGRLRHQPDADPLHQRQHPRPRGAGRHPQHAARRDRRLHPGDGASASFMGVLRLSNNWIVARLAAVYVDGFRNIPVLLWILATMAIITDIAPAPAAFRGERRHRLDALRLHRGDQPRALRPLAGVRAGLAHRGRHLHRLADRDHALRALRPPPPGGDGRDPADLLDQARALLPAGADRRPADGRPDHPRLPGAAALQLPGRRVPRQVVHRAHGWRWRSTPAPSSPRTCAPASRRSRAARARRRARSACGRAG